MTGSSERNGTRLVLEAIANAHESLIELAQSLRKQPGVTEARSGLTLRNYRDKIMVEGYVDAAFDRDPKRSWIIDVWLPLSMDPIVVTASIRLNRSSGQDVVWEREDQTDVQSLATTINVTVADLVARNSYLFNS